MPSILDQVEARKYPTAEETAVEVARLRRLTYIALAVLVVALVCYLAIESGRELGLGGYHLNQDAVLVITLGAFVWFVSVAVLEHSCWPATAKQLEVLRPMLQENVVLRQIVAGWTRSRPLQFRDVRYLKWVYPKIKNELATAQFVQSLNDQSGSADPATQECE